MTASPIPPRGLTDRQAAEYAGVPVAAFKRAAAHKGLRPLDIGGKRRYDRAAIDRIFFDTTDEKPAADTAAHWLEVTRK